MAEDAKVEAGLDLLPKEVRAKLESEHGEIVAVQTKAGVAAFRVFRGGDYDLFNKRILDDKQRGSAAKPLVLSCVVYPDPQTFLAWCDKYPGIVTTCLNPVLELGGVNSEAETKKYGSA